MWTLNTLLSDITVQFTYEEETWIHIHGRVSSEKFWKSAED